MIREELRRLLCAIQFLTVLPAPASGDWREDRLIRAARYYPAAGVVVGLICAGALWLADSLWGSGLLAALLAVTAGIVATSGFHEDGLADTADGLGGGRTPAQRLAIMKDSRLGSYGALALGLTLAAKVLALAQLSPALTAAAVLICAHALARAAAVIVMALTPYAGDLEASKIVAPARGIRPWEAGLALTIGAAPLLMLKPAAAIACALAGALAAAWPALAARRLVGGHTGDVLGAVEQAFETGFLLAAAALCALEVPLR